MASDTSVLIWATAKSTHGGNGRVIVWRYAKDLNPAFGKATQQAESGMPYKEEHVRMNALEDALAPALAGDDFGEAGFGVDGVESARVDLLCEVRG